MTAFFITSFTQIIFSKEDVLIEDVVSIETVQNDNYTGITDAERSVGEETIKAIEKAYGKFVEDKELITKITGIANDIAPYTQRPDVVYVCRILNVKEYNAMAVPGGNLFITKGLIDAVESDDELAGVIAHEIAHNSLRHFERGAKNSSNISLAVLAAILAGAVFGTTEDAAKIATVGSITLRALQNNYSVELEKEADINAVVYLLKTGKYNPTGLYTVMIGFKKIEDSEPQIEYGYLATHPATSTRMQIIREQIESEGFVINIWAVIGLKAYAVQDLFMHNELHLGSKPIYTFKSSTEFSGLKRTEEAVENINTILRDENIVTITTFDIDYRIREQKFADIMIRRDVVFTITDEDSGGIELSDMANAIKTNLVQAIKNEAFERGINLSTM